VSVADRGFPNGVAPKPQHIRAGIIAYAAGDALGVPWEGRTPDQVRWEALEELPRRGDWPQGATSDDTEQLVLVAQYLVEANGQVNEQDFLARLAKALPTMRGAGPTTRAAVRRFLTTGELYPTGGSSIGAAMRALPFGWASPVAAAVHRRELTVRLSRTTHGAPEAIVCACVVAEMAAWAIEQHPVGAVVAAGVREAERLARRYVLRPAALRPLRHAASGNWDPLKPYSIGNCMLGFCSPAYQECVPLARAGHLRCRRALCRLRQRRGASFAAGNCRCHVCEPLGSFRWPLSAEMDPGGWAAPPCAGR
jgi:hypothetical protein